MPTCAITRPISQACASRQSESSGRQSMAGSGNLFLTIDVDFLLQPPNTGSPTANVPPCMTFTATPATVIAPGSAHTHWSSGTGPYQAASCLLSASDGSFTTSIPLPEPAGRRHRHAQQSGHLRRAVNLQHRVKHHFRFCADNRQCHPAGRHQRRARGASTADYCRRHRATDCDRHVLGSIHEGCDEFG